jgi:hypothetical protein
MGKIMKRRTLHLSFVFSLQKLFTKNKKGKIIAKGWSRHSAC